MMLEAVLLGVECRGLITGESVRPILLAEIRRIVSLCEGGISGGAGRGMHLATRNPLGHPTPSR